MNKKQRKDAEFKARKVQFTSDVKNNDSEGQDEAETAEEAPKPTKEEMLKKEIIPGMSGQAATIAMGKRAKKRTLDEQRQREEEAKALKERILAAKLEYEKEKKRKE